MNAGIEVGIAYDLKSDFAPEAQGPGDRLEEYDEQATIDAIVSALQQHGYRTRKLGGGSAFVRAVLDDPPDLVFNIAEGFGTRSREAHVPAVLELLGVPFTHSDPLTLAACLDKSIAKTLVAAAGVPTAAFRVVRSHDDLDGLDVSLPVVAKPLWEGSSMGIRKGSLARDRDTVATLVSQLLDSYGEPVLVEEFCPGPEFTVGILEVDGRPSPLGIMEIAPRSTKLDDFLYSLEVKRNYANEVDYVVPPRQPSALLDQVWQLAARAFVALQCRDVARVDVRVGADGEPKFLEVNPLPGLNPVSSDLAILAHRQGMRYDDLVCGIVTSARARYGL